jgi:hypothetical protein
MFLYLGFRTSHIDGKKCCIYMMRSHLLYVCSALLPLIIRICISSLLPDKSIFFDTVVISPKDKLYLEGNARRRIGEIHLVDVHRMWRLLR